MKRTLWGIFLMIAGITFAGDPFPEAEIVMSYEGGYSPLKKGVIRIEKRGDQIDFYHAKEFYEEPPQRKEGSLTSDQWMTLMETLEKDDVWALQDLSTYVATDGFTYTIEIREMSRRHTFKVYFPELQEDRRYGGVVRAVRQAIGE